MRRRCHTRTDVCFIASAHHCVMQLQGYRLISAAGRASWTALAELKAASLFESTLPSVKQQMTSLARATQTWWLRSEAAATSFARSWRPPRFQPAGNWPGQISEAASRAAIKLSQACRVAWASTNAASQRSAATAQEVATAAARWGARSWRSVASSRRLKGLRRHMFSMGQHAAGAGQRAGETVKIWAGAARTTARKATAKAWGKAAQQTAAAGHRLEMGAAHLGHELVQRAAAVDKALKREAAAFKQKLSSSAAKLVTHCSQKSRVVGWWRTAGIAQLFL